MWYFGGAEPVPESAVFLFAEEQASLCAKQSDPGEFLPLLICYTGIHPCNYHHLNLSAQYQSPIVFLEELTSNLYACKEMLSAFLVSIRYSARIP